MVSMSFRKGMLTHGVTLCEVSIKFLVQSLIVSIRANTRCSNCSKVVPLQAQ